MYVRGMDLGGAGRRGTDLGGEMDIIRWGGADNDKSRCVNAGGDGEGWGWRGVVIGGEGRRGTEVVGEGTDLRGERQWQEERRIGKRI